MHRRAIAVLAVCTLTGCAGSSTAPAATLAPSAWAGGGWTTYMGDSGRTGAGPAAPIATAPRRTWTARVDGDVYAEPLVSGTVVIAATERNWVYALDAATGAPHWQIRLGDPVPLSSLDCGNIDPNGVTSTPVIDAATGRVYVVAMLNSPLRHELFALSLADGSIAWHRAVDPPGAYPGAHQQRGALNLAHGRVYLSFGGFEGDCGIYHGWVVAAPADGGGQLLTRQVSTGNEGGIWSPPGPVISAAGEVWVTTGNTAEIRPDDSLYDGGDAVVRLDAGLSILDSWAPRDWAGLNNGDTDLGSGTPAVLPGGVVFETGKDGIGYLLSEQHLGGIGGEAFSATVCLVGSSNDGARGAPAVAFGMLVVPCTDQLTAVRTVPSPPSFTVAWRAPAAKNANSPVAAYGLVWTVSAADRPLHQPWTGTLVGLDPSTGTVKAQVPLGAVPHFASPAAAGGSLYVGGLGSVYAVSVA